MPTKTVFVSSDVSFRVFSHDVTAAILVSRNNETAAMLMSQTSPVEAELFSYANALFFSLVNDNSDNVTIVNRMGLL